MTIYEDECCDCDMPCIGYSCPNKHAPHWICDDCKEEYDPRELYRFEGRELCIGCLTEYFETVM